MTDKKRHWFYRYSRQFATVLIVSVFALLYSTATASAGPLDDFISMPDFSSWAAFAPFFKKCIGILSGGTILISLVFLFVNLLRMGAAGHDKEKSEAAAAGVKNSAIVIVITIAAYFVLTKGYDIAAGLFS